MINWTRVLKRANDLNCNKKEMVVINAIKKLQPFVDLLIKEYYGDYIDEFYDDFYQASILAIAGNKDGLSSDIEVMKRYYKPLIVNEMNKIAVINKICLWVY